MLKIKSLKNLYITYSVVFLSLVFWAFFAFTTMNQMISTQKIYAKVINITGKQRMLSQRIVLMAKFYYERNDSYYLDETMRLLYEMKEDYNFITSNFTSKNIKNIYYTEKQINLFTKTYFRIIQSYIKNPQKNNLQNLESYSNILLPKLDYAVKSYENESDNSIEKLKKRELFILLGTLLTLLLEAILIVLPSISFNREKEAQLKDLNRQLKEKIDIEMNKNKARDLIILEQSKKSTMQEIINNISHQLRQPLSVISTVISRLKLKKRSDVITLKDLDSTINIALNNCNSLSNLIEDLRSFFNENENKYYTFKEVIDRVKLFLSHKYIDKRIEIIEDIQNISYNKDFSKLVQIIFSILNNSIDALEHKLSKKYIFIDIKAKNDLVFIQIKDNAGGIPENIINKVFEPYFTTKHKDYIERGIGLYSSRQTIETIFNGKITVSNETYSYKNKNYIGACFTVVLPKIVTEEDYSSSSVIL